MARDRTRGRKRIDREGRHHAHIRTQPWRRVINPLPAIELLSDDQLETIHHTSLKVLAEIGMKILDRPARERLARAGATVDHSTQTVRYDPAMVEELVALAPASFTIRARNPEKSLQIGGPEIHFGPVGGPSFTSDLDRGRRAGTIAEFRDFTRLIQFFDILHLAPGSPFEPLDLPAETRYLDKYLAAYTLTDKVVHGSLLGLDRARDAMRMACIAQGVPYDELSKQPVTIGNINTNSPRQIDVPMAQGLMAFAEQRQPVIVTPFTLLGAMAPATIAGALVQQNAEALAGIVLAQVVNPGTPVVYGGFSSNVDMKTGAPAFGTPEYVKTVHATGQLTRRYGIPYRSSNTNASNAVDAQAAYESLMSLWGVVMGHVNIVHHGAGWLEGGLVGSFEKLILDVEMLQMMAAYLEPIVVDEDSLGMEAIREVQPGGHYFGAQHTLARYETAFYSPLLSDWRNFETWEETGSKDAAQRANAIWKQVLKEYQKPPIDQAVEDELEAYVARRKEEGGAVDDRQSA